MLSHVQIFATPWTVATKVPLEWTDTSGGEELLKKKEEEEDLHNPDNHDVLMTQLEPDILECEVKWALESITTNKASGGDGIPVELFQILNNMPANLENSAVATGLEKVSVLQSQRKAMPKNAQTTAQLHSSHTLIK